MMVGQFTPALKANSDIVPFRFVAFEASGVDNQVIQAGADNKLVIGIADGSNTAFDSTNHALTGEEVRLQPGTLLRLEVGEQVDAGDLLGPDANGKGTIQAEAAGILYAYCRAMEDGAGDLSIIDVLWIGLVNVNTATT